MRKRRKIWESNRDMARRPRTGKLWCWGCDGFQLSEGATCKVCGTKIFPKRLKKDSNAWDRRRILANPSKDWRDLGRSPRFCRGFGARQANLSSNSIWGCSFSHRASYSFGSSQISPRSREERFMLRTAIAIAVSSMFLTGCPKPPTTAETEACRQKCRFDRYSCMYDSQHCEQKKQECFKLCQ